MIDVCRIRHATPLELKVDFKPGETTEVTRITVNVALMDEDFVMMGSTQKIGGWSEETLDLLRAFCEAAEHDIEVDFDATKQPEESSVKLTTEGIQGIGFGS